MRAIALFLVAYGQLLAPWLCCCTVAFAKSPTTPTRPTETVDECALCCQQANGKVKPVAPAKQSRPDCPCPVQFSKFIDRPPVKVESNEMPLLAFLRWETVSFLDAPIIVEGPVAASQTADRPWMEMRHLRIRVQHCLLC